MHTCQNSSVMSNLRYETDTAVQKKTKQRQTNWVIN